MKQIYAVSSDHARLAEVEAIEQAASESVRKQVELISVASGDIMQTIDTVMSICELNSNKTTVLVCGSFYIMSDAKKALHEYM